MAKAQKDGPRGTGVIGERAVLQGPPRFLRRISIHVDIPCMGPPPSGILSKLIHPGQSRRMEGWMDEKLPTYHPFSTSRPCLHPSVSGFILGADILDVGPYNRSIPPIHPT
jgi:hypothetical protein